MPQHETVTRTVTLTNTGGATLSFCVTFERPLQREGSALRFARRREAPCGEYGEILHRVDDDDITQWWGRPGGFTMTPEGRLFVEADHRTFEFTNDLQLIRSFEHPCVAELTPFCATWGVTYDSKSQTLWWMNGESTYIGNQNVIRRILALEGDLDGVPTGRQINLIPPDTPHQRFGAGGLSYDPATDLFYFLGIGDVNNTHDTRAVWAVDRNGGFAEEYPIRPEPYPPPALIASPDVHGGAEGEAEGVRMEYAVYPTAEELGYDRVVVVDRWGNDLGRALETPVPDELFEAAGWGVNGTPLRSRTDPNGMMYIGFANFDHRGVVAVRPHPLPPSWLVVDSNEGPEAAWDGTLAPGESREVTLTFRTGARGGGTHTSALQAFDAATGEAVEVPLTLEVTQGTPAEDAPAAGATSAAWQLLAPYPNPSGDNVTVPLEVERAADVRVSVVDVLGREVAVLHEGPLPAGAHRLALGERLPAGLYVVRATGAGHAAMRRIVVQ